MRPQSAVGVGGGDTVDRHFQEPSAVAPWCPTIGVTSQCCCREFADYHAEEAEAEGALEILFVLYCIVVKGD